MVNKTTLQGFFKRLRRRLPEKIRYFAVGEHGTKSSRPHYHCIIFGYDNSNAIYSNAVDQAWRNGKGEPLGFVYHGSVTIKSIMYVCKYHILADENTKGFALMSKSIGKSYVDKMIDFHKNNLDRAFYPMNDKKLRLPRYYKNKLYDKSELDKLARIRTKDMIDIKDYEKFKKKYPKSNYFKGLLDQELSAERAFKRKSNFNQKL